MAPGDYEYTVEDERSHRRSPSPAFDLDTFWPEGHGQQDTVPATQLAGAPPPTQPSQDDYETPVPQRRPTRHVPPREPLTYSADHVRAGRRASKPGTVRGVPPSVVGFSQIPSACSAYILDHGSLACILYHLYFRLYGPPCLFFDDILLRNVPVT